jgi:hypothetical protein
MMAAARILIWLPVRLVRRSRISNMAFPLGACSFLSERRACAPPIGEGYPADAANGKPGRRASHLRRDARGHVMPLCTNSDAKAAHRA